MPRYKYIVPLKLNYEQADGTKNVFIRGKELGRGSFSVVYHVIHQNTDKSYAMKVIAKKGYLKNRIAYENMKNEIKIQKMVNHPNVVSSHYSFSDKHNYYFILEYCPGRNVQEYLSKTDNYRLKEPVVRKILKDVIQGLVYIHSHGITHYDIKLENFVIDSKGNVKIGDFGLSTFHKNEEGKKYDIFGTVNYISPEMLFREKREETYKCDIWAIGISAFYLLTGECPFEGKTKEITFKNIKKGEFSFPNDVQISRDAKDFIQRILQRDPHKRPTARRLLKHPFLMTIDKETVNLCKPNNPSIFNKSSQKVQVVPQTDINFCTETERNDNLKTVFNQQYNEIQTVSPKKANDNRKHIFYQALNGETTISPKLFNDNRKIACCTSINDTSISPKKVNDNRKPICLPPQKDKASDSPRKVNDNHKPVSTPPQKDKASDSPKKVNDNQKPICLLPQDDKQSDSPKKVNDNQKPISSPPQKDKASDSPRKVNDNHKPVSSPPQKDKASDSPKKVNDNQKPISSPPQNDKKSDSPKKVNDDKKPVSTPPQKDKASDSPKKVNDNKKPISTPPQNDKKSDSPKKVNDNQKPISSPPQDDKQSDSHRKINDNQKPICPPLQEDKQSDSPRNVNDNQKSPCCPPLNNDKSISPLNDTKLISPRRMKANLQPICIPTPNDNMKPISPRIYILPNSKTPFSPRKANNSIKQPTAKNFQIPNHFVSRFSFYIDDLGYLLVDGTVGVCFKDKSRIVLDPNEQFVQFYKTPRTKYPDIIELNTIDEENEPYMISLVKKVAKNFKKIRFSYDLPTCDYEPHVLLHNVNCYVKNEDSILFRMEDKNLQVVYDDQTKLIIFWNSKKMCFFKSIREKCCLLDLKSISSFGSNSDELRKFKNAKILLSSLALTIF